MSELIFGVGLIIFVTYMYFLVKMINTQHKIQEKEHGKPPSVIKNKFIVSGKGKITKKESVIK